MEQPYSASASPEYAALLRAGDRLLVALAFDGTLDTDEVLPSRSVIAIRSIPEGATFSQGRPYGESEWSLRPDEIGDLRLRIPKTATGSSDIHVGLVAADGTILTSAVTRLDIATDPKQAPITRADASGRLDDLITHGPHSTDVGQFAVAHAAKFGNGLTVFAPVGKRACNVHFHLPLRAVQSQRPVLGGLWSGAELISV